MSVVFVDPPSPPGFVAFRDSHGGFGEMCRTSRLKFPVLDLFHAASLLLERGHAAAVVDSVLESHSERQCVEAVLEKRPSAVALRTASGSLAEDLALAAALRERFEGPITLFGPQAGLERERILAHPAGLSASGSWDGFLDGGPADLDALPTPRWDLVDYRRYSYVTSQTSWGCPFGCGYCPYPVTQGTRWRTRPAAAVVSEFEALRERYGLRFVLLRDPEFSLERRRTLELCRALRAAGTPLLWGCETRLDTLDEPLIEAMAKAGCVRVAFGVESVEPRVLSALGRKGPGPEEVRAKAAALKRAGMLTYAMYIVGLPGETEDSTRRMADFALELGTDAASFSMATPFPGTRLERLGRREGTIGAADPRRLTGCVPSMRTESLSMDEVESLYLMAKERWNRRREREPGRRPKSALSSRP